MKKLLIGFLAICSFASMSAVKDVGVIGPDGDVILYYKAGNHIVVKNCDPYTILGSTTAQARANCQGKANKVPVESFKQAIRNLVSTDRLNILKPLTPEEIQAYTEEGPSSEQIEEMMIELDRINAFITTYGAENANLVRQEELIKALGSLETRKSVIKKINTEIEKALNLITNQTKLTLTKFSSDKDQFLYTVLKNFNPSANYPCGLHGSVDERIRDCSYQLTSEKEGFVLVTRTKEFKEVHKEIKTGLLWGDRLPSRMNHYNAEKACKADLDEVAKLSGLTWRLPSIEEYEEAEKSGIRKALPNMNYWFWSSSVHRSYSSVAWLFNGYDGYADDYYRSNVDSVRCVARP
jgi:hypothetical protein